MSESVLESSLSTAFTPISISPTPSSPTNESSVAEPTTTTSNPVETTPLVSQEEREKWEEELATIDKEWKKQSAIERKKAEETRARIAAERASTGETWEKLEAGKPMPGPPNYSTFEVGSSKSSGYPGSPSPADVRSVVAGEPSTDTRPASESTLEQSQHWEEVDALESSYPSLSIPSHSEHSDNKDEKQNSASTFVPSPRKSEKTLTAAPERSFRDTKPGPAPLPPSATLSVFDSRLSTRSRVLALLSSLSINLLLPFVNGVMLGFGEIFARSLAGRFGWRIPGGAVTAVGVGAATAAQAARKH